MDQTRTTPIVTVFGGGGFVGRYVCEQLLREGYRVRVAERYPRRAFFLQPLASVGQLAFVQCDLARPATVAPAVAGASAVINLVGAFGGDLDAVHVRGAKAIAEAAKAAGAEALVHVSAIGADANSESTYGRTKGLGEAAVRAAFPAATILRPSVLFGAEDDFTNKFARLAASLPAVPVLAPRTRFQPLWVADLARAIVAAMDAPAKHGGKTYELGGPEAMTMLELNRRIAAMAGQSADFVELPHAAGSALAWFGFLPGAPLTRDQWKMLQHDNVAATDGLAALGIEPARLEAIAPRWLGRFREGGRFAKAKAA